MPKGLHKQLDELENRESLTDAEKIAKDYSVKSFTPFYKAMNEGWGGVGYLLFSKNIDAFQALSGCLQSRKYENFLDLLDAAPSSVAK